MGSIVNTEPRIDPETPAGAYADEQAAPCANCQRMVRESEDVLCEFCGCCAACCKCSPQWIADLTEIRQTVEDWATPALKERVREMFAANFPYHFYDTATPGVWQAEDFGLLPRLRAKIKASGFVYLGGSVDRLVETEENYSLATFRLPGWYQITADCVSITVSKATGLQFAKVEREGWRLIAWRMCGEDDEHLHFWFSSSILKVPKAAIRLDTDL